MTWSCPHPPPPGNRNCVKPRDFFVSARQPPPTLREIRRHLGSPPVLAVQAGIALVLGLSGPFDTFSDMRPGPRMAYWAVVVFATYSAGYALSELAAARIAVKTPRWRRLLLSGLAAGLGAGFALWLINALALENPRFPSGGLQTLALTSAIALVVVTLQDILTPPETTANAAFPPPLLERLPAEKRGCLVSLSVSDHYVEVVTTAGREMILIRLSDAIRETIPTRGMQVHRSHWLALDQVTRARRTGETAQLTTSSGDDIPVSRTYMKPLRETGLLAMTGDQKDTIRNG